MHHAIILSLYIQTGCITKNDKVQTLILIKADGHHFFHRFTQSLQQMLHLFFRKHFYFMTQH